MQNANEISWTRCYELLNASERKIWIILLVASCYFISQNACIFFFLPFCQSRLWISSGTMTESFLFLCFGVMILLESTALSLYLYTLSKRPAASWTYFWKIYTGQCLNSWRYLPHKACNFSAGRVASAQKNNLVRSRQWRGHLCGNLKKKQTPNTHELSVQFIVSVYCLNF